MNIFKRRKSTDPQSSAAVVDPGQMPEPQTPAEYQRRGYAYYARSRFPEAEADFQNAIHLDPDAVDSAYALGMTLKAAGKSEESVRVFQQVLALLNAGAVADRVRADMLRRLAKGHINEIQSGDWNLEKEIWHRIE